MLQTVTTLNDYHFKVALMVVDTQIGNDWQKHE
jgi:hypothetical protein